MAMKMQMWAQRAAGVRARNVAQNNASSATRSSASAGKPWENMAYQMRPWVPIGGEWSADSGAP